MSGLNHSISHGIRMFQPKSLREVINYARLREGQLKRQRKEYRRPTSFSKPISTSSVPITETRNRDSHNQTPKKLSWEELKRKRSLGLCFSCDERYNPSHKCQKSQLILMEGDDAEEEDEEEIF